MKIKCFIFENNIWKRFGNWKRFMFISWKPLNFPHLSPSSTQPLYKSSFLSIYPFFFLLRVLAIVPDTLLIILSWNMGRLLTQVEHCVKSVCIQSFSGPYFPAFGQEKLRTRILFTQCEIPCYFSLLHFKPYRNYCI